MKYLSKSNSPLIAKSFATSGQRSLLCAALITFLATVTTSQLQAQFSFIESFGSTEAPGWDLVQGNSTPGPRLTASSLALAEDPETTGLPLDTDGQGWLRLATRTGQQANSTWLDTPIPAAGNNITASFDFTIWDKSSGTGADGLTFFFYDAAETFSAGADGGSLGYANKTGVDGLAGGYLGLGLDVYGNYSNPTEGRNSGVARLPSEVVLRGPGSGETGYDYLAGTDGSNTTVAGNPSIDNLESILGLTGNPLAYENQNFRPDQDAGQYRYVEIELTDTDQLIVRMQAGFTGPLVELFTADVSSFARPDLLRIGFSGGTGGVNQVYEVSNLRVDTTGSSNTWYWSNAVSSLWSANGNWSPNSQPTDHSDLVFTDQFPDNDEPMVVLVDGADKVVRHAFLAGEHSYTINAASTQKWVMDSDGLGASYIAVLSSPTGNADHSVNVDLDLQNDLRVQHLIKNQTLTLGGDIDTNGNDLYLNSFGILEANGAISDSGDLYAQGSGTKVLTGNNTYTGNTIVEGGVLQIESNNALGSTAAGTTVEDGASLAMAGNITTPAGEALTISGQGVGELGALVSVDGSNTWGGAITLADDSTIGALGTSTLNIDGIINTDNANGYNTTLFTAPDATINVNSDITDPWYSGAELIKTGAGIANLNANTSYTGNTTVEQGTLSANVAGALGQNWAGDVYVNDGATLALGGSGFSVQGKSLFLEGQGVENKAALWSEGNNHTWQNSTITLNNDASIGADSGTLTLTNSIVGNGNDLTITGNGVVALGFGNVQSVGELDIQSGTFRTNGNQKLGNNASSGASVNVESGATLDLASLNGSEFISSLSGAGDVETSSNFTSVTVGGNNQSTLFSGNISGSSAIIKTGTGEMTFSGTNTADNLLRVDQGTVLIGADNVFADTMDLTLSGGTFATNGFAETMDTFTLTANSTINFRGGTGGYLTFDDMIRNGGLLTIDQWAGSLTGNGNTRLQVTATSLGGNLLNNTTFTGWGAAQLLNLGGGLYELVPTLSGFSKWTDGDNKDEWDKANNWSGGVPDGIGDRAYFGNDPTGTGLQTVELDGKAKLGTMILDSTEHTYQMLGKKKDQTLTFDQTGNAEANLIVSGNKGHVIGSSNANKTRINIELKDDLRIQNNSSFSDGLTFGTLNGNHTFDLKNDNLTVTGTSRTTIHNQITGSGSIILDDVGRLRLTDTANNFSGGVTMNDGTIEIGSNSALGTGTFTINGGAAEAFGAARSVANAFSINNSYAVNGTNDLTFSGAGTIAAGSNSIAVITGVDHTLSGALTGAGGIAKEGNGTLSLTGGTKTFSGGLTVNGGTVDATRSGDITLGSANGVNNIAGAGAITANTGGTVNLTQTGNNGITLSGAPLTNNGGTINITSTGNNGNRDFLIGTDAANTGELVSTGGTTNINVGDDIRLRANSNIDVSGGTVNLTPADAFITEGTSGNAANIEVTGTGSLNIDISGARSDNNAIRLGEFDQMTVNGANAQVSLTGQADSAIDINGRLNLYNSGRVVVEQGTTAINSTARLDGGAGTSGTLEVRDNIVIAGAADITNAPNLNFNTANDISISGTASGTGTIGWGIVSQTGTGTTTIDASINNIAATTIVIDSGTLMLGDNDQIANNTNMVLAGGTFSTNNNDEVLGTLTLSADSIIDFGNNAADGSILKFADSSNVTWDASATLTIINWDGIASTGDGIDQLFFGTTGTGLTAQQRSQIVWADYPGNSTYHLSDGEVVPVPEPGAIAATLGLSALIGWRERKRLSVAAKKLRRFFARRSQLS